MEVNMNKNDFEQIPLAINLAGLSLLAAMALFATYFMYYYG